MPRGVYPHRHNNLPVPGPGTPMGSRYDGYLNPDLSADIRHFFGTGRNAWRLLTNYLNQLSLTQFMRILRMDDCFDTDAQLVEKAWMTWTLSRLKHQRDLTETRWCLPPIQPPQEPPAVPDRPISGAALERLSWFGTDRGRHEKLGLQLVVPYQKFTDACSGRPVADALATLIEARVKLWEDTFLIPD